MRGTLTALALIAMMGSAGAGGVAAPPLPAPPKPAWWADHLLKCAPLSARLKEARSFNYELVYWARIPSRGVGFPIAQLWVSPGDGHETQDLWVLGIAVDEFFCGIDRGSGFLPEWVRNPRGRQS